MIVKHLTVTAGGQAIVGAAVIPGGVLLVLTADEQKVLSAAVARAKADHESAQRERAERQRVPLVHASEESLRLL